jgi:hypothetical protein
MVPPEGLVRSNGRAIRFARVASIGSAGAGAGTTSGSVRFREPLSLSVENAHGLLRPCQEKVSSLMEERDQFKEKYLELVAECEIQNEHFREFKSQKETLMVRPKPSYGPPLPPILLFPHQPPACSPTQTEP